MTFAAPLWLIGLVPWAAVTLYLLWGRHKQQPVPFIDLWLGPVAGPRARRKLAAPPLAVLLVLLAALLALVGAGRPFVKMGARRGPPVTVVVDRGATMSARGAGGGPRFLELGEQVAAELQKVTGGTLVDVVTVPGGSTRRSDAREWIKLVRAQSPTAVDTAASVAASAAGLRAGAGGPIVVISDHDLGPSDERLIQVAPEFYVPNAGIVLAAVRESPRPQVMVRVRNTTTLPAARLEITCAGRTITSDVPLPTGREETRDVFVDLPAAGDVVVARLIAPDAFDADNVAWLVRQGAWPRIEPRAPVAPELARFVRVYSKIRSPGDDSPRVVLAANVGQVPPGSAAVVVAAPPDGVGATATEPAEAVQVVPHPVTRNLETLRIASVRVAQSPPDGWTPVVRIAGKIAVAVREQPARQAWVGFNSPDWPRMPEYVVFWTNVFDWVGGSGGGAEYRAEAAGPLGRGWRLVDGTPVGDEPGLWPGLFERTEDGARRAVNALDFRFPPVPRATDWKRALAQVLSAPGQGRDLAPALLVAAVACLALGSVFWRSARRRGPPVGPPPVDGAGAAPSAARARSLQEAGMS